VFTWLLIAYAEFVVVIVILLPSKNEIHSIINGTIFHFFTFLAISSHLKAMLSDPGAVPKGNATKESISRMGFKDGQVIYKCPKCVCIKPERAHHCSICQRCIRKMDHHCPWVNNCVGENNQKYFVLFTMYVCIISCHALYMTIYHFVTCVQNDWKDCPRFTPAATTIMMMFLIFEGLLFGLFTAIMCGSQLTSICEDETGIEQLKHDRDIYEKRSCWTNIRTVFGRDFSFRWFSPFHNEVERTRFVPFYSYPV